MKTRQLIKSGFLVLLCGTAWPGIAKDLEPRHFETGVVERDIPFNDPVHQSYFNYQDYLVKHGQNGETKESWAQLPATVRADKIARGEADLNTLRSKLQAKTELSVGEMELWQAVWGDLFIKVDSEKDASHAVVTHPESVPMAAPADKISALNDNLSKNLETLQRSGDWGHLFDGNAYNSGGVDMAGAIGASSKVGTNLFGGAPKIGEMPAGEVEVARPREGSERLVRETLPLGNPISDTLPLATAGAVLLAGAYFGLGVLKEKSGASSSAGDVLSGLAPQGFGSGYDKIGTVYENPVVQRSSSGCNGGCSGNCAGGCSGNCTGGCMGGCAVECVSACAGGASGKTNETKTNND
jgi:hypothetical protein